MSSETINADDSLKAEMEALVQEKLRTGAYLAELKKSLHSSDELNNLPKKWSEWCSTKLTPNDVASKELQTLRSRRRVWYHKMKDEIATPQYLSVNMQFERQLAQSDPKKREALSEEFVVVSELYDASLSEFRSIEDELTNIKQKFAEEENVLELAICVNRNKATIEFLCNELKIMKKK